MRKQISIIFVMLALAVVLSACGTAVAQAPEPVTRTLSVNGSAQVFLTPDIAYISIGVQTENQDATEAVAGNNAQATAIIDGLKARGIDEKDIQTSNFSIYPNQQYDRDGELRDTVYMVNNTVKVTVRDISQIGEMLDAAVTAGANNVYGIQFDVSDKTAALSEARKAAVANASTMAAELAEAAGVTLGPIKTINFYGGAVPMPVPAAMGRDMLAAQEVPLSPGETSLTAEVHIEYEIR